MKSTRLSFDFAGVDQCIVEEGPTVLLLRKLVVAPLLQGQGIGSRVLRELKRKGKTIHVVAYPDDPDRCADLYRFYTRNGFADVEGTSFMAWNP